MVRVVYYSVPRDQSNRERNCTRISLGIHSESQCIRYGVVPGIVSASVKRGRISCFSDKCM